MSKPPNWEEWGGPLSEGCNYRVAIRIFPSVRALRRAGNSFSVDMEVEAFCEVDTDDGNFAILNFYIGNMTPEIIAHECFHAVAHLVLRGQLNLSDPYAQELAAHSLSDLVAMVLRTKREYGK